MQHLSCAKFQTSFPNLGDKILRMWPVMWTTRLVMTGPAKAFAFRSRASWNEMTVYFTFLHCTKRIKNQFYSYLTLLYFVKNMRKREPKDVHIFDISLKNSASGNVESEQRFKCEWQPCKHFYTVSKCSREINFNFLLCPKRNSRAKYYIRGIFQGYFWATPFRKKWSDRQIFTSTVFKNAQRCLPAWWRRWLGPSPRLASWCASRDAPRTRWRWRCRRSGSGRRSRAWCIDELWPVWPDLAHFETFWRQIS